MVRGMMGSGIILRGIFRIPLTIIPLTSFLAMIDFDILQCREIKNR